MGTGNFVCFHLQIYVYSSLAQSFNGGYFGPKVALTVANRNILPHSDWLASPDRSQPIIMPYLPIFAMVSFNVTIAKICKYSAMIG